MWRSTLCALRARSRTVTIFALLKMRIQSSSGRLAMLGGQLVPRRPCRHMSSATRAAVDSGIRHDWMRSAGSVLHSMFARAASSIERALRRSASA